MAIPAWFKLLYTLAVLAIVVIWYRHYGWRNFLWFSDIALIGAVPALWLDSRGLSSIIAVAVLVPELLWNADLLLRLLLKRRITGLTDYMFETGRPMILRAGSLFHVPLPFVALWMLAAYGYSPQGFPGACVLAAVVMPLSRRVSSPAANINWSWSFGPRPQRLPGWLYVLCVTTGMILVVYLPTHLALLALFG